MRKLLWVALTASMVPGLSGATSRLDVPVAADFKVDNPAFLNPCAFAFPIEQLGRQANLIVGYEATTDCWLAGKSALVREGALDFTGLTPRQALDRLMQIRTDYSWKEADGVVLIRPTTAWDDSANVLNRPVAPFSRSNTHLHYVLHKVLESARPSLFQEHTDLALSSRGTGEIDVPASVTFAGGTLLEALDRVATSSGVSWELGYADGRVSIGLRTVPFSGGSTMIPSAPLARIQ